MLVIRNAIKSIGALAQHLKLPNKASLASDNFFVQGHRGSRGTHPENTLPAFKAALDAGVHHLELDVVVSSDNKVVVSHEAWFNDKFCSFPDGSPVNKSDRYNYLLYQMPYSAIKKYDCGQRKNEKFENQQPLHAYKPLLTEVIDSCDAYANVLGLPKPYYLIEVKSFVEGDGLFHPKPAEFVDLVGKCVYNCGIEDRCMVQAFNKSIMRELHEQFPNLTTGLLIDNYLGYTKNIKKLGYTPDVYSVHKRLLKPQLIEALHQQNILCYTWTVNDLHTIKKFYEWGVDSIATDYPAMAKTFIDSIKR